MAILPVLTIGNPLLRVVARDVEPDEIGSAALQALIEDMIDTMHHEQGIGLAAPQIGASIQVAVIEIDADSDRYPGQEPFGLRVFLNPKITILDGEEQGFWEGCLSVPNLRGFVERPRRIRVSYLDLDGAVHAIEAEGFLATVFQHELDHLQGVLYVDRMRDLTKLATLEDYAQFWREDAGEQHLPD
ncbi:MAG TPA: peptide deformylase [Candidatus Binatia bacterium]|jgi:peptide deformylase